LWIVEHSRPSYGYEGIETYALLSGNMIQLSPKEYLQYEYANEAINKIDRISHNKTRKYSFCFTITNVWIA